MTIFTILVDPFPHFPFILMEVLSLDSWNRFRTEGYTYLAIPPRPGELDVYCQSGSHLLITVEVKFLIFPL